MKKWIAPLLLTLSASAVNAATAPGQMIDVRMHPSTATIGFRCPNADYDPYCWKYFFGHGNGRHLPSR